MEIIDFEKYQKIAKDDLVVAIGQFDGFHVAHQVLLDKVLEIGHKNNYLTGIITFNPHPDYVLKKTNECTYLITIMDKAKILAHLGFDYMIIVNFNEKVASTLPQDFVNDYLLSIHVKEVVVGYDFCFGYKGLGRAGMITSLSNNQIKTTIIDEIKYQDEKLGTTLIKKLLASGKVDLVTKVLGRPYCIEGKVVSGRQIGRTINLPTANIQFSNSFVQVKTGVYGVIVEHNGHKYLGLANFGNNPSFNYHLNPVLEVHLLNFSGDLYGEYLKVYFIEYIRDEITFDSKEKFINQIDIDKAKIINDLSPLLESRF